MIVLMMSVVINSAFAGNGLQWSVVDKSVLASELAALNKYSQHLDKYEVNITESSYEDYYTNTYHERSEGYFKKNKNEFHSYIQGVHTIQTSDCRLVIDSSKKIIMVANPLQSLNPAFSSSGEYEILFKLCTHLERANDDGKTYYKVTFSPGYAFTSYELIIKDSLVEKVIMFYSKKIKKGSEFFQPRVEIDFDNWTTKFTDRKNYFDINTVVEKKGSKYVLTQPYVGKFKFSDQRVLVKTTKK